MTLLAIATAILVLAALPTLLILKNLSLFQIRTATPETSERRPPVSVLIPARNEAAGIETTLRRVLASEKLEFEVIVLDDDSQDETASIVGRLAAQDSRLSLQASRSLPDGWNGKQHACWQLAEHAKYDLLLFLDADVHVQSSGVSVLVDELEERNVDLLSGFPRQQMETLSEKMLIPMMYYVLLGYLPLWLMRSTRDEQFGAGCGQIFLARREAYFKSGGHRAIQASRHDGLKLPRSFRKAGLLTDLLDASDLASVRMYTCWNEVRTGLLKNAAEGIANWKLIFVFTLLLAGGSVAPLLGLAHALLWNWPSLGLVGQSATMLLACASVVSYLGALHIQRALQLPLLSAVLHPLAVVVFIILQWIALLRDQLGLKQVAWRGRSN